MQELEKLDYHDFEVMSVMTTLARDTELDGDLEYHASLKIEGKFNGSINTEGFLWIDKNAEVNADINARFVKLGGTVRGNINARGKLEILEGAKLFGDVKTSSLKIYDGTIFEGKCDMIKN